MKGLRWIILLTLVFLILFFFLSYKITEIPPGMNGDEAAIGHNALLLAKTGKDENGKTLPLFVSTLNGGDWKQPVTMYSTVVLFKLFDPSYALFRQVSVLIIIISSFLLLYFLKKLFSIKAAFLGLVFFVTSPIIMIQSHLALENIGPLPFVILWLIFLYKYTKIHNKVDLFISGFILGSSIFSYQAMRIIFPVYLAVSCIYLYLINTGSIKKRLKNISMYFLGLLPFLFLLIFVRINYPGALNALNQPKLIKPYQEYLLSYLSSFDLSFLFLKGDSTGYHSTGKHGVFLLGTLVLFLIGCYKSFKEKNHFLIFMLICFILTPLFFGTVNSVYRASRLLAIIPFYITLVTYGFISLLKIKNNFKRIILVSLIGVLLILNYFDFIYDYWYQYPSRAREYFNSTAHLGYKYLYDESKKYNLDPYIQKDIKLRESKAGDFFQEIYFPSKVDIWTVGSEIPTKGVVLSDQSNSFLLEEEGYKNLNIQMPNYAILIKQ